MLERSQMSPGRMCHAGLRTAAQPPETGTPESPQRTQQADHPWRYPRSSPIVAPVKLDNADAAVPGLPSLEAFSWYSSGLPSGSPSPELLNRTRSLSTPVNMNDSVGSTPSRLLFHNPGPQQTRQTRSNWQLETANGSRTPPETDLCCARAGLLTLIPRRRTHCDSLLSNSKS
ncbi:hypothetical protein GGTG_00029 [Gaeumannomyces tritici R3-111a-1]|uniref:Uncharacterized protein n=1 Tax=Gaeumannomyces tritici (strain R3-111a-1) TaxID=644352 RepID=J3NFI3_GAET3|nr:hypothetical protein GGTG_00029 [Gaeumannomyces tritici R3-111a-1]EJT80023.1 hypothetical protein GGTG_00029 [Gaeumannomyces tritici R3-111a-1]